MALTTSSLFLKTLDDAGITHAFVNWGSDHPALLEDLARQAKHNGTAKPSIVTCPNEMVALSCAHGYALATGKPAAVIVHVDVGTQALAAAIHNADRGRVPVLIYAGASPFTAEGEIKGSRNEWIMGLQDIHDQTAIVRQYMRYTAQILSGNNAAQVVMRGLQHATSEPKGPVYIWSRRETMEEEVAQQLYDRKLPLHKWTSVEPCSLSFSSVETIAEALLSAKSPLIVTSYIGRNHEAVAMLAQLSNLLSIPVFSSCPATVNFPSTHPNFAGVSFGFGKTPYLADADIVLVIDSDIPWIPTQNRPTDTARVFHIDIDPLKAGIGFFHLETELVCRADALTALQQIVGWIGKQASERSHITAREKSLQNNYHAWLNDLMQNETTSLSSSGALCVPYLLGQLRQALNNQPTVILNEAISSYPLVWNHLLPTARGSMFSCGAAGLGWGLGASIGMHLGSQLANGSDKEQPLVVLVVGDGSYMFGVPSSAYWIARRYNTPFLTVILNNAGWNSPKLSMLGVYPNGIGSKASGEQLTVGFGPDVPLYADIAVAAGAAWGKRVTQPDEVPVAFAEAVRQVREEKRCAVLDCVIDKV